MKPAKKLSLKKETLTELTSEQLEGAAGGAIPTISCYCPVVTGPTCLGTCTLTDNCTYYKCPTVPVYTCLCLTVAIEAN